MGISLNPVPLTSFFFAPLGSSLQSMKYVGSGQNPAHPEVWLMTETIPIILTAVGHQRPRCSGHHRKPGKQSLLQRVCALIEQSRQTKSRKKGNYVIPPPFYTEITEMLRPWNPGTVVAEILFLCPRSAFTQDSQPLTLLRPDWMNSLALKSAFTGWVPELTFCQSSLKNN